MELKNIYAYISFSQEYNHHYYLAYDVQTYMVRQAWVEAN
jgi:hypothetical protein